VQAVVRMRALDGGPSLVPDTGSGRLELMLHMHLRSGHAGPLTLQLRGRVAELLVARGGSGP
jgi:hypothetical protein